MGAFLSGWVFGQAIIGAEKVGKYSYKMLTEMIDTNREERTTRSGRSSAPVLLSQTIERAKNFGPVDVFKTDKVLMISSLSEIFTAATKMQTGNKPTAAPQDYDAA